MDNVRKTEEEKWYHRQAASWSTGSEEGKYRQEVEHFSEKKVQKLSSWRYDWKYRGP